MYRVLLVEDEEIELETLRDYIDWKKNGISRVFTARNGRRALECLEENMADIVITDIQMPGMSGIELAETIVRRGYPCKIVFLTGYDDFSYIHSAFQVNAVDYLLKPFTIEEVEACLKKVRSELEKSEIADWSRKTAAKQLLEMALREKQETELLRKNFRGVFGEELEECRFGIIAVYGKTEENICSQIQEKYKGIRYISKTERISILLLAGYLSVKDTAFQIWNDLKEDAPRPLDGAVEHGQLTACTKRRKNFGTVVFWHFIWIHRNFSVQMKKKRKRKKHIISGNRRSGEKKSVVWSATGKSRKRCRP